MYTVQFILFQFWSSSIMMLVKQKHAYVLIYKSLRKKNAHPNICLYLSISVLMQYENW